MAGFIGHTQPRRVAARSVSQRIADELGAPASVGFKIRFADTVGENAHIKLMTDGIALAELHSDPNLLQYDTLILDEAHERSLNIDFLLGYLKRLLPQRPDLKLIITSATIDPQRLAAHFDGAPVLSVEGRTWPVEVRYREAQALDDDDPDATREIADSIDELWRGGVGDVLVFQPGERGIRDAAAGLAKRFPDTDILPLFGRLNTHRAGHEHRRDLTDGAGHNLCNRHRYGAYLSLQREQQSAAPADRKNIAGLGHSTSRALRAPGTGGVREAVQRSRLPRTSRVH